ncbi:MAG: hypothetical protein KDJ16_17655, partial [Hyphomicrobiales bacterium]|nr:hypothetical protein [Hyphomicrobiales bacterium]
MSSNQSIQQLISATRDLVPSREAARRPAGTAEFSEILRRHNTDDRPEIDRADQAARRPVEERPERSAPTRHADNRSDRTDAADDDIDRYRTERNDDTEPVSRSKSRDRSDQVSPRDEAETPSDPETAGTDDADGETVKTAETTNGETTESVEIALNDDAEALLPFVTEAEAVAEAEIAAPVETVITAVAKTTAPTLPEGSAPAEGSATSEATALEGAGKSAQVAGLRPATAEPAPQVAAAGAVGEANRAAVAANAAAVGGDIAIQASAGRTHKPTLDGTGSGDGEGDTPAAIRTPATDVSGADPDAQPNRASDTAKPAQFAARPGYAPVFAETVRQAMAGNTKAGTADTMLDNSALGAAPRGAMTFGNIRLSPVNGPAANPSLSAPAIAAEIVRAAHNGRTRFEIRLDPP